MPLPRLFHADPSHGWLEVPLRELLELNLIDEISQYSYIDPKREAAYLERASDAGKYISAQEQRGVEVDVKELPHVNGDHWIRDLRTYRPRAARVLEESPASPDNRADAGQRGFDLSP